MGQGLHGSATTAEAVRRAIQHSQASLRTPAKLWHQPEDRRQVEEATDGGSANGSEGPKINLVVDRRGGGDRRLPPAHTAAAGRLPLRPAGHHSAPDALDAAPLPAAPRHQPPARGRGRQGRQEEVQALPIGYFHIDIAEVRTEQGRLYLLVAIDRTSEFAFVELHEKATTKSLATSSGISERTGECSGSAGTGWYKTRFSCCPASQGCPALLKRGDHQEAVLQQ